MPKISTLNNVWLKAAVLGCLWAASEIILGSFLHNLKLPFRSNILTSVGIVLLISAAHIWKEKGLFWRAGLICALMKSISPSAIILGPMIAILSESILMELSVRILRRNMFSFVLAGILAMSWNLFHMIINYIIIYGFNIIELYKSLSTYSQLLLKIQNDNVWWPLLILLFIYSFMGFIAAAFGIYIGRKTLKQPLQIKSLTVEQVMQIKSLKSDSTMRYSMFALFFNLITLIGVLYLMAYYKWYFWLPAGTGLMTVWAFRYKRSLKPLAKIKFWLFFICITLLSAFLLSALGEFEGGTLKGLFIGLEMNFRAALTIIGFSTLGTELRNPNIKSIFSKSRFQQVSLALEVAFDALPMVVANLPRLHDAFRKPVKVFHELVSQIDLWLDKIELKAINRSDIIFITGHEKTGKSTFLSKIVEQLKQNGLSIGGFISPSVNEKNIFVGYDLISLKDYRVYQLSRITGSEDMPRVGNFYFNNVTIAMGHQLLNVSHLENTDMVVIDEVGPWEIKNNGWASSINSLLKLYDKPMIWVVRESIIAKAIEQWTIHKPLIINAKENDVNETTLRILKFITERKTKL